MRITNILSKLPVLLLIPEHEVKPQERNNTKQRRVASEMNSQGLEITWVAVEKHLGSNRVTRAPREEVHGDADGFLGLAADVTCEHGHAETLGSPEGENDPVGDEQTGFGGFVCVFDGHDDDCAGKGGDHEDSHGE